MFCGWTCDRGIENSERKDNYNLMSETSLNLKHEETISSVLGAKKHFYIILFCFWFGFWFGSWFGSWFGFWYMIHG